MTYSFNLTDQKWIPGVHFDGRLELFSLRDILTRAHELRGLQGDSPLETAAMYRLLLAVLHSALRGPRKKAEWATLWQTGYWQPELVNGYLDQWHDRFDLFHPEKPFYQAIKMDVARDKTVNDIMPDVASANNATLFSHNVDTAITPLTPSKAARTLLVLQTMSIAGGWGMAPKESSDAPWGRGIIFFVEGDFLFQTLALNLMTYPDKDRNNLSSSRDDRPAWEKDDPFLPIRQVPDGYLDYLTWQNRRVRLTTEGAETAPVVRSIVMASGLKLDSTMLDPMKLYRAGKEDGYISTRFSEDRALWRDSASLFALKNTKGMYPPKNFYWLADLAAMMDDIASYQKYRFMAFGMANDQAKVEFFQEDHLPLPLPYLTQPDLVEKLANALQNAEDTRFALKIASQWMAVLVIAPKFDGKKWQEVDRISKEQAEKLATHWNVDRFYWQQLEIPFLHLLEDLPQYPEVITTWQETLRHAAGDSLEQAANAAGMAPLALKAAVRARERLGYSLKELFEPHKEATA
jgi:CRISPR system Cascade subunit CasA